MPAYTHVEQRVWCPVAYRTEEQEPISLLISSSAEWLCALTGLQAWQCVTDSHSTLMKRMNRACRRRRSGQMGGRVRLYLRVGPNPIQDDVVRCLRPLVGLPSRASIRANRSCSMAIVSRASACFTRSIARSRVGERPESTNWPIGSSDLPAGLHRHHVGGREERGEGHARGTQRSSATVPPEDIRDIFRSDTPEFR